MKKIELLLWSFLISMSATGCFGHLVYPSDSYRGKVIDAETKEPLVGAVVLAIWYREAPGLGHGPAEDYHDALEVLADENGEFIVPAKTHVTTFGKIREPEFVIYYPGYGFYPWYQVQPPDDKAIAAAYRQRFFHVELRKSQTREERLRNINARPARVPIEKMPSLTRLVNIERISLDLSPLPVPGGR